MPRTNIRDILKDGATLEPIKYSMKEVKKFLKEYNEANWDYLKSVETRKRIDWNLMNKPMEI